MPHEGFANPITNDGPEFHSNMPISELTECVTRAIEESDVSSTPPIVETTDEATITKMSWSSTEPVYTRIWKKDFRGSKAPKTMSARDQSLLNG